MKSLVFYTILCLSIIVAQTTILRPPFFPPILYDFFIPMVVFARFGLSVRAGLFVTLVCGLMMDLFSGGQYGVYVSIYAWIFFGAKGVSNYFDIQGKRFRSILIALFVLIENLVCCLIASFPANLWEGLSPRLASVFFQVFLAAATGPLVVRAFEAMQRRMHEAQHKRKKMSVSLWMEDI